MKEKKHEQGDKYRRTESKQASKKNKKKSTKDRQSNDQVILTDEQMQRRHCQSSMESLSRTKVMLADPNPSDSNSGQRLRGCLLEVIMRQREREKY